MELEPELESLDILELDLNEAQHCEGFTFYDHPLTLVLRAEDHELGDAVDTNETKDYRAAAWARYQEKRARQKVGLSRAFVYKKRQAFSATRPRVQGRFVSYASVGKLSAPRRPLLPDGTPKRGRGRPRKVRPAPPPSSLPLRADLTSAAPARVGVKRETVPPAPLLPPVGP